MSDWPVGLSTGCFYQQSIFDCLEAIRLGGFSTIEVCSFPAHLDYHDLEKVRRAAELVQRLGLEAYSFHAPFADHIDITSLDGQQRQLSEQEILRAAEAAAAMGVRYFVIHPGPEHSYDPPREEYFQRMKNTARVLNEVARRCHELGMRCVLENKLPHLLFGRTSDLLWIMGAMNTNEVGVCLDTGHAFLAGGIDHVLHKLSGHLQMIHASDNLGQHDDHKPPGEGKIDWQRLCAGLAEGGFRGTMILEIAGGKAPDLVLEDARRARRFLREIMKRLSMGG